MLCKGPHKRYLTRTLLALSCHKLHRKIRRDDMDDKNVLKKINSKRHVIWEMISVFEVSAIQRTIYHQAYRVN